LVSSFVNTVGYGLSVLESVVPCPIPPEVVSVLIELVSVLIVAESIVDSLFIVESVLIVESPVLLSVFSDPHAENKSVAATVKIKKVFFIIKVLGYTFYN
jgi:hypothetical protein